MLVFRDGLESADVCFLHFILKFQIGMLTVGNHGGEAEGIRVSHLGREAAWSGAAAEAGERGRSAR
jgi:hypothetical protein